MAGSCLQSFVAPPANGVAQLAVDLAGSMQHATAVGREKEGEERRGRGSGLPTGKFKRATLAASQMPKTGRHKLELELGHELDWLAQCVRARLVNCRSGRKVVQRAASTCTLCGMQHLLILLVAEQEAICQSEVKGATRGQGKGSKAKLTHM